MTQPPFCLHSDTSPHRGKADWVIALYVAHRSTSSDNCFRGRYHHYFSYGHGTITKDLFLNRTPAHYSTDAPLVSLEPVCWGAFMAQTMGHTFIIGASGSGKSTLLKTNIIVDMEAGHAVCFIDPHGEDIDDLMQYVPRHRLKDTILFDPTDPTHYITWNPLAEVNNPPLMATSLSDTIKDAWGYHGQTTPVLDMYLFFTVLTLIENHLSFFDSLTVLTDKDFRAELSFTPVLQTFWNNFDAMTPKEQRDSTSSTLNKLFVLFGDERLQRLLASRKGQFTMSDTVKDKILFVKLPQGQLGLSKVSLIGSVLLSQMHLACLRRDPTVPFHLYIDEVHHFAPSTLSEMLSGLRKFNVSLTVAHQYIEQLERPFFAALMGNAAERHIFTVSPEDADRFQERLGRYGSHFNLDELEPHQYRTFPWHQSRSDSLTVPLSNPTVAMPGKILTQTRRNYCKRI